MSDTLFIKIGCGFLRTWSVNPVGGKKCKQTHSHRLGGEKCEKAVGCLLTSGMLHAEQLTIEVFFQLICKILFNKTFEKRKKKSVNVIQMYSLYIEFGILFIIFGSMSGCTYKKLYLSQLSNNTSGTW